MRPKEPINVTKEVTDFQRSNEIPKKQITVKWIIAFLEKNSLNLPTMYTVFFYFRTLWSETETRIISEKWVNFQERHCKEQNSLCIAKELRNRIMPTYQDQKRSITCCKKGSLEFLILRQRILSDRLIFSPLDFSSNIGRRIW